VAVPEVVVKIEGWAVKASDFVVVAVLLVVPGQLTWDTVGAGVG